MRLLRDLPPEVRALTGVAFMVALGFGLVAPALPLFAREFGVGKAAAGAVVSVFALMRLVMAPFVGRLVNALGERVLLATGIGVVAVSSALAGLSQSYWQLLVLRGAGGVGSIMFSVSAASLLVRVTPSHLRGRAQGVWAGSFLIGLVVRARRSARSRRSRSACPSSCTPARSSSPACSASVRCGTASWPPASRTRSEPMALARRAPQPRLPRGAGRGLRRRLRAGRCPLVDGAALRPRAPRTCRPAGPTRAFLIVSLVSGALLLPTGKAADTIGRRPVIVVGLLVGSRGLPAAPGRCPRSPGW